MRILTIGTDRTLFTEGSPALARVRRYASLFDELHIIVFTLRTGGNATVHEGNLHIYKTASLHKLCYGVDAFTIAKKLRGVSVVSAQDPFETGLIAWLVARWLKAPLQLQLHTDLFSPAFSASMLNRVRRLIARFLIPRAAGVRVTTGRIKDAIEARYRVSVPIAVLPIMVDVEKFKHVVHTPHPRFVKTILWVGRFEEEKNPSFAIDLLASVRDEGVDAGLIMVGAGSLESELHTHTLSRGLEPYVEFPGWRQDLASYYAQADVLICTSHYEGYGMVIVEALAAGVPVVSTDVGVAREAGARVTSLAEFLAVTQSLLRAPHVQATLQLPIPTERAYLEQYRKLLEDCVAQYSV